MPYASDRRNVFCVGLNYNAKTASLHPGCKRMELIEAIGKSARTIDRALAELISSRLIAFRGRRLIKVRIAVWNRKI